MLRNITKSQFNIPMKKIYFLVLAFVLTANFSFAQWTTSGSNIYYNTGAVGIGTTTPTLGALQINGGADLISLYSNANNVVQFNAYNSPDFRLIQRSNAIMTLWTNTTEQMRIDQSGNVGIGTTSLPAKFNVYQNVGLGSVPQSFSLLSTVSGLAGTGNDFQNNIWLVRNAAGSDWYTTRLHDGISIDGTSQNPQVNTLTWWERDPNQNIQSWGNGNATYLTIHNGNVGIGTTDNANWQLGTSTYKLAVNGSIVATAITVKANANWPDYVFNPTYKLIPLSELKEYVNQNNRLPGFPSAADVSRNGLNLGETDKLLTRKVEELTLYLIEKDEQSKEQQQQIDSLKNQVNSQQEQLDLLKIQLNSVLKSELHNG